MRHKISGAKIAFQTYNKRFFIHPRSREILLPILPLYVVIPVYAEDALQETLKSINDTDPISTRICIILVINCKADDTDLIKKIVSENLRDALEYNFQNTGIQKVVVDARNLDSKNAGVGLARKIGMDAVVLALQGSDSNPWLICLDSDCTISKKYFQEIESKLCGSTSQVAVFGFSHQPKLIDSQILKSGILQYELFLEYYRLGLKTAGFPFFYHTVGSSMACTAFAYAKSGGMNQRKAGEDFYFLHKLFPNYLTTEITEAIVFPSPRISNRVPFGTGRFQLKWQEAAKEKWETYNPEIFQLLNVYLKKSIEYLKEESDSKIEFLDFSAMHSHAEKWLIESESLNKIQAAKTSSPDFKTREKAFFQFFDGFKALKFVHFFQPHFEDIEVEKAISILLPEICQEQSIIEKLAFVRNNLAKHF